MVSFKKGLTAMLAFLVALPTWLLVEYIKAPIAEASESENITVDYVTASTEDGYYKAGSDLDIVVVFSDDVYVKKGTPKLSLDLGSGDHFADYQDVDGNQMYFAYQVRLGDDSADLNYKTKQSLRLNNGAVIEGAGEDHKAVDKTLPSLDSDDSLASRKNIVVDTVSPVVTVNPKTTDDQTPSLSGNVNDLYLDEVSISVDGKDYPATVDDGEWILPDNAIDPALVDGTYDIVSTATDLAGNSGADETINELIVNMVPTVRVDYSTEAPTNQDVVATLVGVNKSVTVTNNEGLNTYTFTVNGDFTFEYTDGVGHTGSVIASVRNIDKEVPERPVIDQAEIISPINADEEKVTGTAEPLSTVLVTSGEYFDNVIADESGDFEITLPLIQDSTNVFNFVSKDAAGNESAAAAISIVEDSQAPTIIIERDPDQDASIADYNVTITYGDDAIVRLYSLDGSEPEDYIGTFPVGDEGLHTVTATGVDRAGNHLSVSASFTIDKTAPVIELNGPEEMTIEVGTEYDEAATVSDNFDKSVVLDIRGSVDWETLGVYLLSYDAEDNAGNEADQKQRIVHVVDTTIPVITLIGEEEVSVLKGNVYNDAGATVLDNNDKEIELISNNPVDSTVSGEYLVTYNATDSAGNYALEVTRKVTVYANIINVYEPDQTVILPENYGNPVLIDLSADATNTVLDLSALQDEDGVATLIGDIIIKAIIGDTVMTIVLPAGTEITGPEGWNGKINLPTLTENIADLTVSDGSFAKEIEAISIGLTGQSLSLSAPVKITFEGRASRMAGFVNEDGEFVEITNICADSEKPLDEEFSKTGECKAFDGEDLIIWTKHFTDFVYYSEEEVVAPKFTLSSKIENDKLYVVVNFKGLGDEVEEYIIYVNDKPTLVEPAKEDVGHKYEVKIQVLTEGTYSVVLRAKKQNVESLNDNYKEIEVKKPVVAITPSSTVVTTTVDSQEIVTPEIAPTPVGPARASASAPKIEEKIDESTDDDGIIKGDDTKDQENEDINWTPWIILFILIILAGAATGGYFYWFAGEEDGKNKEKPEPKKTPAPAKKKEKSTKKKYRRW